VTLTQAKQNAQANANYSGKPYVVFSDTSGNLRIERYDEKLTCHREMAHAVLHPQPSRGVT